MSLMGRRYRRILIASVLTLLTSAILLGLIGLTRWRGRQALQSDTHTVITQTGLQLIRTLQSRRGTLTFLRDTMKRRPTLGLSQLQAMGASAVEHTRHLLGDGMIRAGEQQPAWWSKPAGLSETVLVELSRAIAERTRLRGIWRVPSTFVVTASSQQMFLVMLEPLRPPYQESAIVGVFDLTSLLEDFFSANLAQRYPAQLLDGATLLFRSSDWKPAAGDHRPLIAQHPVRLDAARWLLQMQPGSTGVVKALSWLNILLIALSIIAGAGITVIVWILAARAWILERAVTRRTAALRRALKRVRQLAITDELTGLYNRRFFLNRMEWEWERARRYRRPLACLMIDVNSFKEVNDRLGHQFGDRLLQQVAQELKLLLRQSDILARFGGDEFVIALPETSPPQAVLVANKLRQISIHVQSGGTQDLPPISLSVGMSHIEQHDASVQEFLEAADKSLYEHKRSLKTTSVLASH